MFLFSIGYGSEGQDDVGVPYRFVLGESDALPAAVAPALLGMRAGGKRRVLVPPALGWTSGTCAKRRPLRAIHSPLAADILLPTDRVKPRPPTFGAWRRLANHANEPLLFEAEMVRVRPAGESAADDYAATAASALLPDGAATYRLPLPPALSPAGASRQAMY